MTRHDSYGANRVRQCWRYNGTNMHVKAEKCRKKLRESERIVFDVTALSLTAQCKFSPLRRVKKKKKTVEKRPYMYTRTHTSIIQI